MDWQYRAWTDTIELAIERGMKGTGDTSIEHLLDMDARMTVGFSPGKLGRWLGWAQCALYINGVATLEELKEINRRAERIMVIEIKNLLWTEQKTYPVTWWTAQTAFGKYFIETYNGGTNSEKGCGNYTCWSSILMHDFYDRETLEDAKEWAIKDFTNRIKDSLKD